MDVNHDAPIGLTSWDKACEWYTEEEVYRCIQQTRSITFEPRHKIPDDIYSREFAAWMTEQYRLAMAKGIQIGRGLE
jgi:hypothetical protein